MSRRWDLNLNPPNPEPPSITYEANLPNFSKCFLSSPSVMSSTKFPTYTLRPDMVQSPRSRGLRLGLALGLRLALVRVRVSCRDVYKMNVKIIAIQRRGQRQDKTHGFTRGIAQETSPLRLFPPPLSLSFLPQTNPF
jgi:hypothetical protein